MNPKLTHAYHVCKILASEHSENFPIASFLIPKAARKHFYPVYLYLRIGDNLADHGDLPLDLRLQQLLSWKTKLNACMEMDSEDDLFLALGHTIRERKIPIDLFHAVLNAYNIDLIKNRYRTMSELLEYCEFSANPVGRIVLYLLGYSSHAQWDLLCRESDALCTGLQLVNHWQDIFVDQKKNRLYLPLSDMELFSYSETNWKDGVINSSFVNLLKFEIDLVRQFFSKSFGMWNRLNFPERCEIKAIWLSGMTLLEKIESIHYNVRDRRPSLQGIDKIKIGVRSLWK